jgi:glycosyltransferase involved in cell wall biosynthesis
VNIVILSDHESAGGAATATSRVDHSLRELGLSAFRCYFFPSDDPATQGLSLDYQESATKRQLLRPLRKLLPASFPRPNTAVFAAGRLRRQLRRLRPDVINVHNLHAAAPWGWGPHLVEVCLEFAPVAWTLHDMWSFTGRCAYSYDCEKFIAACDASCPTPTEMPALMPENIRAAWDGRRAIYARHRDDLTIVTPSRWLADQARRGMFARHRIEVIPYGFRWGGAVGAYMSRQVASTFRPVRPDKNDWSTSSTSFTREAARRKLGINPAGPILLIAAFDLTERRKGAEILPRLWPHIQHRPLTILTMGNGNVPAADPLIEVHPLGYLDDDRGKALAYSAADALLHPAPVDNFPNVVLEALACGTPTIALPVGGLPEMVRPGISGWLADAPTAEALGIVVDRSLQEIALGKNLRESCWALAEQEYSLELQGRRYFELFQQLQRR